MVKKRKHQQTQNYQKKWEEQETERWDRHHRETPEHKFDMEMNSPSAELYVTPLSPVTSGSVPPSFFRKKNCQNLILKKPFCEITNQQPFLCLFNKCLANRLVYFHQIVTLSSIHFFHLLNKLVVVHPSTS